MTKKNNKKTRNTKNSTTNYNNKPSPTNNVSNPQPNPVDDITTFNKESILKEEITIEEDNTQDISPTSTEGDKKEEYLTDQEIVIINPISSLTIPSQPSVSTESCTQTNIVENKDSNTQTLNNVKNNNNNSTQTCKKTLKSLKEQEATTVIEGNSKEETTLNTNIDISNHFLYLELLTNYNKLNEEINFIKRKHSTENKEMKNEFESKLQQLQEQHSSQINTLQSEITRLQENENLLLKKYYHHALLAIKLKLELNFNLPELLEMAVVERVEEEKFNDWVQQKLQL
ncbi:hypothetical protein ABK040_016566 [Willaertia magna]